MAETDAREGSVAESTPRTDDSVDRVDLGDCLTIAEVEALRGRLLTALDLGDLRLAAADVEQIDAAGVQLLCAAVRDAQRRGRSLVWEGVSERLRAAAAQLGLAGQMALSD